MLSTLAPMALEANHIISVRVMSVSTLSMKILTNSLILVMFPSWRTFLAMAFKNACWVSVRPRSPLA